ncbi:hydroxymethylpyrimidine/phosphomethylpyrimidine kinase [uncultured Salinisphaera sp.]|uniref:bifunctional hydroxymethylpyrimidine kinase/phosphomethylpyrimidine kinase n=1 Tax=uncultured Salinisphaera sp. TaxID=359372 RepID=UPI0032B105B0|tara:strand:- start:92 stop:871 length:780 start_codon:yes stop_codon:yes gene_type:complete
MKRPNILVIAGHDPSGGAGIQADIEAAAAHGVHAATVISLLTCQDTHNVYGVKPVASDFFAQCLDAVVADMHIDAVKLGVIASAEHVAIIARLMDRLGDTPLVIDPVLVAAGGGTLADDTVGQALQDTLFERACAITPNAREARALCAGEIDLDRCGEALSERTPNVLITGGDEGGVEVVNRRYARGRAMQRYQWPRIDGVFHGSGCTLASAVAARIALGHSPDEALQHAQQYTWETLERAFAAGGGQRIPARIVTGTP